MQHPQEAINPEQTASIWSLALHTFMGDVIFQASNVPHLAFDKLPPMPDYDMAPHLVKRSFKV
jgi:hypothetical protein